MLAEAALAIVQCVDTIKKYRELTQKNPQAKAEINEKIKALFERISEHASTVYDAVGDDGLRERMPTMKVPSPKISPSLDVPRPLARERIPLPEKRRETVTILAPDLASRKFQRLSKKEKDAFIKELKVKYEELEGFVKGEKLKRKKKIVEVKTPDFSLYQPNAVAVVANRYMKEKADRLIRKYPKIFQPMFDAFLRVDMAVLSRSYVAMILLFGAIAFPVFLLFFFVVNIAFKVHVALVILFALLVALMTPLAFYFYPQSLAGDRQKKIKRDLPFALVHMSAVAGSGAAPISIFELLAESEEYPELKKEIKKVLNFVNVFGYNLSTALRNVAATTPSEELKELLNGMVSTVEAGGDLKQYLNEKSEDALVSYRLERKKQVDALGTYSEVYTSILIASPLLLIVTLAIINTIGGQVAGISVKLLATLGVWIGLPLLNAGFMFFLKTQAGEY
ncbi:MAG TPA: type II secretion system F family protein [Candidatus Nanoarchaeia archaeon]|nr:type II secretion system F family protein [Candidatus Nanoarchaeia archaeon]